MRLFDSNVLIYDALPERVLSRISPWIVDGAFISVVTRIEVLGFPNQSRDEIQAASRLLSRFGEVPLHEAVIQQAISRRRLRRIRLGDAVIAASAIEEALELVTRNTSDFDWIDGLVLIDPFEN